MSDYIPEHLMPEILKWLPVKSLARFRCVRRSWNNLFPSASFVAAHLACSSTKPRLLLGYKIKSPLLEEIVKLRYYLLDSEIQDVSSMTLVRPFETSSVSSVLMWPNHVVGSINGVICLSSKRIYPEVILWNPLIRKYIPLPRDEPQFRNWGHCELLGFGVNDSEDDFRVIRVSCVKVYDDAVAASLDANWDPYIVDEYFMVEVCSARDRIWRALDADILENCNIIEDKQLPQCLVNGVVHWIVVVDDDGGSSTNTLLVFDFEKEELGFLALPEIVANSDVTLHAARFRGMLGVLRCDGPCCGIWVMSEYGNVSSWSFIINIRVGQPSRELKWKVQGLTEGGQILISDRDEGDDRAFLFNPANRSYRRLRFEEEITKIHVPDFVESLIFMNI